MRVDDWVEQITEHGDYFALGAIAGCLEDMLKAKELNCESWENTITETSKVVLEAYKKYKSNLSKYKQEGQMAISQ